MARNEVEVGRKLGNNVGQEFREMEVKQGWGHGQATDGWGRRDEVRSLRSRGRTVAFGGVLFPERATVKWIDSQVRRQACASRLEPWR